MKTLSIILLSIVTVLVGCTADRTLETLVPRSALAVVLVDRPALVQGVAGASLADLPWLALDGAKPWAGYVLSGDPPGFQLAVALKDEPSAWSTVEHWAQTRGGLSLIRLGSYAVLSSPGTPAPAVLSPDQQFGLDRVRFEDQPVAIYLDLANLEGGVRDLGPKDWKAFLSWTHENWDGLRVGLGIKGDGVELRLATDAKKNSPFSLAVRAQAGVSDLAQWSGFLPSGNGFGALGTLSPELLQIPSNLVDAALVERFKSLRPLLGPRFAFRALPRADGTWAWAAAIESHDPRGFQQALKTGVAGGEFQRNFSLWAMDSDTPLIYKDNSDGFGGVRTKVTWGGNVVWIGYGTSRISFAGGAGAEDALHAALSPESNGPATWYHEVGSAPQWVATGAVDGLGARASVHLLPEGNVEARLWCDGPQLAAWEQRLPQVLRSWLSGPANLTHGEP